MAAFAVAAEEEADTSTSSKTLVADPSASCTRAHLGLGSNEDEV
jgi:hypothetical protein